MRIINKTGKEKKKKRSSSTPLSLDWFVVPYMDCKYKTDSYQPDLRNDFTKQLESIGTYEIHHCCNVVDGL